MIELAAQGKYMAALYHTCKPGVGSELVFGYPVLFLLALYILKHGSIKNQ